MRLTIIGCGDAFGAGGRLQTSFHVRSRASTVLIDCGVTSLIGMNSVVNDNAEIGEEAVVAALAFVKAEAKVPPRSLVAGIPAKVLRELSAQELQWKKDNMHLYQQLAVRSLETMQEVEALTEIEPNRKRIDIPGAIPLSELKAKHG